MYETEKISNLKVLLVIKFIFFIDMESRTSTEQSSLHLQNEIDEIELILKPHPNKELNLTSKRFLKTTSNATSKLEFSKIMLFYIP